MMDDSSPGEHVTEGLSENDPSTPLLPHSNSAIPQGLHLLFLIILAIIIVGGIVVGIWLFIDRTGGEDPDFQFNLVRRAAWGARPAKADGHELLPILPPTHVVILHTVTEQCLSASACEQKVREIQDLHMDHFHFSDIGYSFLVGGDGRVYEGRGWDIRGAFSRLLNKKSLGVAFIGDFEFERPVPRQLTQGQLLLKESVSRTKLTKDYCLVGHRQVSYTLSPGQKLYDEITTWPHWENCHNDTC